MSMWPEQVAGQTWHGRRGGVRNAFRYGVDYVLIDPESAAGPVLFSRNRWNFCSVEDRAHGGPPKQGRGVIWAREVLAARGFSGGRVLLLTQPRFLGYVFNPVSFWLAFRGEDLCAVIAEVNNTFGDRHSYVCHHPGFEPIGAGDRLTSVKIFHVSPFQDIAGTYHFNFDVSAARIAIRIAHENGGEGVIATLTGGRRPLSNVGILRVALLRPFGAFRTLALIHWQALKLTVKGARFRSRPVPPEREVS